MPGRFIPLLFIFVLGACNGSGGEIEFPEPVAHDLDDIAARDTLVVLTQSNSTSYFLYRGEPMGFEYEFLRGFAREHDLEMKTVVARNRDSLLVLLNEGVGDVVAARQAPTSADSTHAALTHPLYATRPVLVQREAPVDSLNVDEPVASLIDSAANAPSPDHNREAAAREARREALAERRDSVTVRARRIERPDQLFGERVHVVEHSALQNRLMELSVDGDIHVVEIDTATLEMLTEDVAHERINYTVSHQNLAKLQEANFTNLRITPTLDEPYEVAWAVRTNAPQLRQALNDWIAANPGMRENLYEKYFVDRREYSERVVDEYLTSTTGRLSVYDDLFRQHAPALQWDWRLLASQAFQESRFQPRARSWAGAMGLLQLMPATARERGVADAYDPEQNVAGAVDFLQWLQELWADKVADEEERLKFILASYNAGPGHVLDARRLTEKYGGDPDVWREVAYWLLRKSEAEVYRDPVVKYGFCRGLEPVTYVARILDRYEHYQQFVAPDGAV